MNPITMKPKRREVLELLSELSQLDPEIRLGQWLTMFSSMALGSTVEAIYEVEDEDLVPVMKRFLENRRAVLDVPVASSLEFNLTPSAL